MEKTKPGVIFSYVIIILSLIIPGVGYLYFFHFDLFKELEILKVILISVLFSLPLFFISLFTSAVIININKEPKKRNEAETEKGTEEEEEGYEEESKGYDNGEALLFLFFAGLLTLLYFFMGLFLGFVASKGGENFQSYTRLILYGGSIGLLILCIVTLKYGNPDKELK